MSQKNTEKEGLYSLLRSHGYDPVMRDVSGSTVSVTDDAEVFQFNFDAEGDSAPVSASIDDDNKLVIYYGDDVKETGSEESWYSLLKELKRYAQTHQLSFQLKNKDHLRYDMAKRNHMKKINETQINEGLADDFASMAKGMKNKDGTPRFPNVRQGKPPVKPVGKATAPVKSTEKAATSPADWYDQAAGGRRYTGDSKQPTGKMVEGYYPTGRKSSYSDSIPEVKIILQHSRALEEGERRYRAVEKIFVENTSGERFAIPTNKPGLARVYARHVAEGGTPYDEQGKHITSLCEEYNKMAGFVRATRNKQFNESAQSLVNEGIAHYQKLRESLHKLSTHRGYHTFFENWTPTLMEDDTDATDLSEMFASNDLDPRIESVMPILRKLNKSITEVDHSAGLTEWADDIIDEALQIDEVSNELLGRYKQKAGEYAGAADKAADIMYKAGDKETGQRWTQRADKKFGGIVKATNKQFANDVKPKKLDEISNELLGRYKKQASEQASGYGALGGQENKLKAGKRARGIFQATKKQFHNDVKGQNIGEGNTENVAINPEGIPESAEPILHKVSCSQCGKQFESSAKTGFSHCRDHQSKKVVDEGRMIKGAGGVPLDRQGNPITPKVTEPKASAGPRRDGNGLTKDDYGTVWRKVEEVVGQIFPDGDPIDWLAPWLMKKGIKDFHIGEVLDKASRLNGYKDIYEYYDQFKNDDYGLSENLSPEQKAVGQLGPQEKVGPKGAVGKLVGANESVDPLSHIIKLSKR